MIGIRPRRRLRFPDAVALIGAGLLLAGSPATADESGRRVEQAPGQATSGAEPCGDGETLATGAPDSTIFAREASRGVQAFWCETYDREGRATRAGAYWDIHPNGSTRIRARYVASRIEGPVEVLDAEGGVWLRGAIDDGEWEGPLELFHPNGNRWLSARFRGGRLDGPVETRFPDGSVESRTRFQDGLEEGLATSYAPIHAGGGLRSEIRVEADRIVDTSPRRPADASSSQAALPSAVGAGVQPAALASDPREN